MADLGSLLDGLLDNEEKKEEEKKEVVEEKEVLSGNTKTIVKVKDEKVEEDVDKLVESVDKGLNELKDEDFDKPIEEFIEEKSKNGNVIEVSSPFEAQMRDMEQVFAMLDSYSVDVLGDLVYRYQGKPVLTLAGLYAVMQKVGNIKVTIERIERTPTRCVYKAKAVDLNKNIEVEAIGVVDLEVIEEEVEYLKKERGKPLKDYEFKLRQARKFIEELASSFATRRALKMLIDERYWARKFDEALGNKIIKG